MEQRAKTDRFTATMGVVPGYFHLNDGATLLEDVARIWQEEAAKVFSTTNCYVGAVCSPSLTVYNVAWGCPLGGERTVLLTGERNPFYYADGEVYRACAVVVLGLVAKRLEQATTQLSFSTVDFHYLDFREDGKREPDPKG